MKSRKVMLIGCLSAISVFALALSSIALAKYIEYKKTDQSAYGLGGERMVSLFFNANIWKEGKDSEGNIVDANYYIYVWNTASPETTRATLIPSAHVTPTVGGTAMDLYVFEFDSTTLNSFIFLRWDPEIVPSTDLEHGSGHGNWNQTTDQAFDANYNYYCIDAWGDGNPATADPTRNKIIKNGSTLSWAY